ncbi:MAG: hypothetical protein GVY17_10775 [Cyanobacteria bacterium]|jgi:hypothetical protein|nr:hypothetical protein [Cyanobacteria bacterium GSL.Bin21]
MTRTFILIRRKYIRWFHTGLLLIGTLFQIPPISQLLSVSFGINVDAIWKVGIAIVIGDLSWIVAGLRDSKTHGTTTIFDKQVNIYHKLQDFASSQYVSEVKLFQYSGRLTQSLVRDFLRNKISVKLYIQHPSLNISIDGKLLNDQQIYIENTIQSLERDCHGKSSWGNLEIYGLGVPVSIRAAVIGTEVIAFSTFAYTRENETVTLLDGDEMPGTLIYRDSLGFKYAYDFLRQLETLPKSTLLKIEKGQVVQRASQIQGESIE